MSMSNPKRVREEILRDAGWVRVGKKWGHPDNVELQQARNEAYKVLLGIKLVCVECHRSGAAEPGNNFQCPFCGGNLLERP